MGPLDRYIASMRGLVTLDEDLAELAAPALEEAARANVRAGLDPDGNPWPRKKDGTAPLKNAANAITCTAQGNLAVLEVDGVEAFHQKIKGDGPHPRRKLIPEPGDAVPAYLGDALEGVVAAELARRFPR